MLGRNHSLPPIFEYIITVLLHSRLFFLAGTIQEIAPANVEIGGAALLALSR
jgi:hypothetical protein